MSLIGYARVIQDGKSIEEQVALLKDYGCNLIRIETQPESPNSETSELTSILKFLRSGDTIVVTRLDRLSRSMKDFIEICEFLDSSDIGLISVEQNLDSSYIGKGSFLALAKALYDIHSIGQGEKLKSWITKAKKSGKVIGRERHEARTRILIMLRNGSTPAEILQAIPNVSRSTIYKINQELKAGNLTEEDPLPEL